MKQTFYKQSSIILVSILISSILFSSCKLFNNKNVIVDQTTSFVDNNWDYEHRLISFDADIKQSDDAYKITLIIDLAQDIDITSLPLTVSIYSPDGAESHKPVFFYFTKSKNEMTPEITGPREVSVVAYPKKYFNTSGKYTFKILKKSTNYDLFGIKSLRFKIEKIKS